jgi:hypothetical protein
MMEVRHFGFLCPQTRPCNRQFGDSECGQRCVQSATEAVDEWWQNRMRT